MDETFNEYIISSWYFEGISRDEATDLLMGEKEGVFLVRKSICRHGNYVLCVSENATVTHYAIDKIQEGKQIRYSICNLSFPDIPSVLAFFKSHRLNTTSLTTPTLRRIKPECKKSVYFIAKNDIEGDTVNYLPCKKGEILILIRRGSDWSTARNCLGQEGAVPMKYLEPMYKKKNLWKYLTARWEEPTSRVKK